MNEKLNREGSVKLYVQLSEIIKKKIDDKEWPIDSQIPTEEELCKIYGVSKATVRLAVQELVRLGHLMRQQGRGTFVCKRVIPEGLAMSSSFKELMLEAGVSYSTEVLAQTVMMPTDDLDVKLGINEDKHVIYIRRLRKIEGEPVLLQENFVPYHICPKILEEDVEGNSVFELLESKCGTKITRVEDYIEVIHPNADDRRLLGIGEGSYALLLDQYFYSGDEKVMYMRSVKRPERFRLYMQFEKRQ